MNSSEAVASTLEDLRARVGQEVGLSGWRTIDQGLIDRFAALTGDEQFIHVDGARAAETPFGGTIAHGFLTLSLLSAMAQEALPRIERRVMGVNYGFDRVRFLSPVPAGARVRSRFVLSGPELALSPGGGAAPRRDGQARGLAQAGACRRLDHVGDPGIDVVQT